MAQLPLDILQCPVTKGVLRLLDGARLAKLNEEIAGGAVRTLAGDVVQLTVAAALVSEDGTLAYPLDEGIAALLGDRAIVLAPGGDDAGGAGLRAEKQSVQDFYDVVGWQQDEDEVFVDTARFVDTRPLVQDYLRECRLRIGRELPPRGEYLVDVASGPVQFPEYVGYQEGFDTRICVDLSKLALTNAQRNVGPKGVFVQGDIVNLPFRDGTIDAVLSLHTIYHVPRDEQPTAFLEVHRVLKPGGIAVVAYSWGHTPWRELPLRRRALHLPGRLLRRAAREIGRLRSPGGGETEGDEPELYFHAYDRRWFVKRDWPFHPEIRVHHVFSSPFLEKYVRERLFGRQLVAAIRRLEDRFPRFAGRFGYPLIVIRKD